MAGEKIVFFGNCQATALANVYSNFFAFEREQKVFRINGQERGTDEGRELLSSADIVIWQHFDFPPKMSQAEINPKSKHIYFPMVTCGWLWPFAGQERPSNERIPERLSGPYPGELGDRYLNRMIQEEVAPQAALDMYKNMDINKDVNLDRFLELNLSRQRKRDAATGFDIASCIEKNFFERRLFLTPNHPGLTLFAAVVRVVYQQLGISSVDIDFALSCIERTPFPTEETPIHPSVISHYKIPLDAEVEKYSYFQEGEFTFDQFVKRYVANDWNRELAISLNGRNLNLNPAERLGRLDAALGKSPGSVSGHRLMALLLAQSGQTEKAILSASRTIELKPSWPDGYLARAEAALHRGDLTEAELATRDAIEIAPRSAAAHRILAIILDRGGDISGAIAAIRQAVAFLPGESANQYMLARFLARTGEVKEAISILERCVRVFDAQSARMELVHLYQKNSNIEDSAVLLEEIIKNDPENLRANFMLFKIKLNQKDIDSATKQLSELFDRSVNDFGLCHEIAMSLDGIGLFDEGIRWSHRAIDIAPLNPHLHVGLARLLRQKGEIAAAEVASRQAVRLEPTSISFRRQLVHLLVRRGDLNAARYVIAQGLQLLPDSRELVELLSEVSP